MAANSFSYWDIFGQEKAGILEWDFLPLCFSLLSPNCPIGHIIEMKKTSKSDPPNYALPLQM